MKSIFYFISFVASVVLVGCGGNTPQAKEQAKKAAEAFVYKAADKAAIDEIKAELSDEEVVEFEQVFESEMERLMSQVKADAEAFVHRIESEDNIDKVREEVKAYADTLSPEASEVFMKHFSEALSQMIRAKQSEL